ncbi:MAG: radical SAM protein [Patescibacteria group bacterium]|nr:radical SAM protein [Patescibacteria group bacterium]
MKCNLCPHNCSADRINSFGVCQAPADFKIAHIQLHKWEEPCISGAIGSGAIFFSHCNLKCVYCQNYQISQLGQGKIVSENDFIDLCLKLKKQGAHNLNFVTPTPYSHLLIKLLPEIKAKTKLPIVWNSNAYEKVETLKQLNGLVDIYLPDFKYYNNELAIRYSKAPNYLKTALNAITEMVNQIGEVKLGSNGLIKKGVIIRHLILPDQIEDSKRILKSIKENFGDKVWVSLMSQYYPMYLADQYPELNKKISSVEYNEIKKYYEDLKFAGGYFQELESADKNYTPKFDANSLL